MRTTASQRVRERGLKRALSMQESIRAMDDDALASVIASPITLPLARELAVAEQARRTAGDKDPEPCPDTTFQPKLDL